MRLLRAECIRSTIITIVHEHVTSVRLMQQSTSVHVSSVALYRMSEQQNNNYNVQQLCNDRKVPPAACAISILSR